jgi:hypothetical protein
MTSLVLGSPVHFPRGSLHKLYLQAHQGTGRFGFAPEGSPSDRRHEWISRLDGGHHTDAGFCIDIRDELAQVADLITSLQQSYANLT